MWPRISWWQSDKPPHTCDISVMILALYSFPLPSSSISAKNVFLSSISWRTRPEGLLAHFTTGQPTLYLHKTCPPPSLPGLGAMALLAQARPIPSHKPLYSEVFSSLWLSRTLQYNTTMEQPTVRRFEELTGRSGSVYFPRRHHFIDCCLLS